MALSALDKVFGMSPQLMELIKELLEQRDRELINASHPDIKAIVLMLKDKGEQKEFSSPLLGKSLPKNPFNI